MAEVVYIPCALTSLGCAVLLGRGYLRSRHRLLVWSTICFAGVFLNNVATVLDLVVLSNVDLGLVRAALGFVSVAALAYGLIWEAP